MISSDEDGQHRRLRPHPPKASPTETVRKEFRRRSNEHREGGASGSSGYERGHRHRAEGGGETKRALGASKQQHRQNEVQDQTLFALESEIRVLSAENATYCERIRDLEARLKRESEGNGLLQQLQASHEELLNQLQQADEMIHSLQEDALMLKQELQDQHRDFNEKQKAWAKKVSSMELVQEQVVMENSRLHSDIRKERTLRENCEIQLRAHVNHGSSNQSKGTTQFTPRATNRNSFLSPDALGRRKSPALRTAGKASSPAFYAHNPHQPREPLPRLEGVIHLENRGRTNQQTFDLFKPFDEGDLAGPSPPRHHTPRRPLSHALKPSPRPAERPGDLGATFRKLTLSPPFATNPNRTSEVAVARLEKRLLELHEEKQKLEDERGKLERARETVMGRKRKQEIAVLLSRLNSDINNTKTAIRRLALPT